MGGVERSGFSPLMFNKGHLEELPISKVKIDFVNVFLFSCCLFRRSFLNFFDTHSVSWFYF